jgi:hypothetical protein
MNQFRKGKGVKLTESATENKPPGHTGKGETVR